MKKRRRQHPETSVSSEFLEHVKRRYAKADEYAEFCRENPPYPHYVPERDDIPMTPVEDAS